MVADLLCQRQRAIPVSVRNPVCEIHIGLIDRNLLDQRSVPRKDFHKSVGILPIGLKVRRYQHQLRTLLQGLDHRFAGLDAVLFGRNGLGCDDPVPCLHVAAHS